MRRPAAAIATVAIMAALIGTGWRRPERATDTGTPDPADGAEARVNALLESAWRGDVTGYLASFRGPIRLRLEREAGERGQAAFADELRRAARSRKSHAVFAPEADDDDSARVTVEAVYPDRNERQTFRLDRGPDGWLVTEVETVRSQVPKTRFGDPATYQEPEGVPVQSGGLAVETGDDAPGREDTP